MGKFVIELWKTNLASSSRLVAIGKALDAERQVSIFDEGLVGMSDETESEVILHVARERTQRSEAGSRKGQRTSSRSRWRPPGQTEPFRSRAVEEAHGTAFRNLAKHYETLGFEDRNGLWVAVKTKPLGSGGPQAYLLVAVPIDKAITPRAWAFQTIGSNAELFPLKHTNFPDASICAFTKASGAWIADDGLLPLVDHYSLWIAKSWHRTVLGSWPGPQVGVCALYRRREFVSKEYCGCESGKLYAACHQGSDLLVPEDLAYREFLKFFPTGYEDRQAPVRVLQAARTRWKNLPDMAMIFAHRSAPDEPEIPFL